MTKMVEHNWSEYLTRVIPQDAGPVQISESHNCFWAGAASVIAELAQSQDKTATLESLELELLQYAKDFSVKHGIETVQ